MPFALRENPDSISPDDLDDSWSRGWFRMRQTLFTTHFLEFEDQFYSAVWLRVDLRAWKDDRRFEELRKRNRRFSVEFRRASTVPSAELEGLFADYRDSIAIDVAPSLVDLLIGHETQNVFDSWEVVVRDGEKAVAAGVFDKGNRSAAGITSFYAPEYKKYSLGKYLIYLKMEFCREQGLDWFYPGYFVPGRPQFDYKLTMAPEQLEYLDLATGTWLRLAGAAAGPDPLAVMVERLAQIGPPLVYNRHLSIHLSPQIRGVELFDFPVFLNLLGPGWEPSFLIVVFDPRDGLYHLIQARSVYRVQGTEEREDRFESDLLQVERLVFSTPQPEDMVSAIQLIPRSSQR